MNLKLKWILAFLLSLLIGLALLQDAKIRTEVKMSTPKSSFFVQTITPTATYASPLMLLDWRNPASWTAEDRSRAGHEVWSVSARWTHPPSTSGQNPRVLMAISPGYLTAGDSLLPVGDFHGDLGRWARSKGYDIINGKRRALWRGDRGQNLYSLNFARREVATAYANWLVARWGSWGWVSGIHFDYFTSMAWWHEFQGPNMDAINGNWDGGLLAFCETIQKKTSWVIVGQQYHNVWPAALGINGRFIEQAPTWWLTFNQHRAQHAEFKARLLSTDPSREILFVYEIRDYKAIPAWYRDSVFALASTTDGVVSMGRDKSAFVP